MAVRVFLTGFPGFIARNLVARLRMKADVRFSFLVEERLKGPAEAALDALRLDGELLVGDITQPDLSLAREVFEKLTNDTTHVWHLAALYDLSAPLARAYRVNVIGTANVLDVAERCPRLARFDYVSTCYVCGTRTGLVLESELDCGQSFKNHYEATKCWAEMEVKRRSHRIPTTVYRPSIVVGDSRTGETEKYDGPYYVIQLLERLPRWLPLLYVGGGRAPANVVPVDWVVDAMAEVWIRQESIGRTIHLSDPHPHSTRNALSAMAVAMGFRKPIASIPPRLVETLLGSAAARRWLGVPRELISYFNTDVRFDTTEQQKLLERTEVRCPGFSEILPALVGYHRQNPMKRFLDGRAS